MFVVDTNILLYAVNPDSPDHDAARTLVDRWRREDRSWFLTWGIIYEFLRVSTHQKVFASPLDLPRAQAWIEALRRGLERRPATELPPLPVYNMGRERVDLSNRDALYAAMEGD